MQVDGASFKAEGVYFLTLSACGQSFNTVTRYDPVGDAWQAVAPMATGRAGHAAAVHGGRLYVFGGEDAITEELGYAEQRNRPMRIPYTTENGYIAAEEY